MLRTARLIAMETAEQEPDDDEDDGSRRVATPGTLSDRASDREQDAELGAAMSTAMSAALAECRASVEEHVRAALSRLVAEEMAVSGGAPA